jgi:hypothetical protein
MGTTEEMVSGQRADPYLAREAWVQTVRSAIDNGKEHLVPTRLARTPREAAQAATQQHYLSRTSFSVPALPWHKGEE